MLGMQKAIGSGDILLKRRWGWTLFRLYYDTLKKAYDGKPCILGGSIFRKHLWKGKKCRRCLVHMK